MFTKILWENNTCEAQLTNSTLRSDYISINKTNINAIISLPDKYWTRTHLRTKVTCAQIWSKNRTKELVQK